MSSFEFNAPQFLNFSDVYDPKADRFFDVSEQTVDYSTKSIKELDHEKLDTENQVPSSTVKSREPLSVKNTSVQRKHLHEIFIQQNCTNTDSINQVKNLPEQMEKLQLSDAKQKKSRGPIKATEIFSGVKCEGSERKTHPMTTRLDAPRQKSSSMQSLNSVNSQDSSENHVSTTFNDVKALPVKRNGSPLHSAKKFISLAEQVENFYKNTPERCRSKPSKQRTPIRKTVVAKPNCIPKTPNLATKYRQRKVDYPDEKLREEMELEEIKKHQIKARPLNEKILMGACLNLKAPIIKKPVTVPQPFSLTEVKKKEPATEPVFQFKAQPIPTTILNGPVGIPPKRVISPTIPNTPQLKVPTRLRVEVKSQEKNPQNDFGFQRSTKIEPRFSFDARMKDLLQKKEEFVRKVIEEEKKSFNSFKAHPMPNFKSKHEQTPKIEKQKTIPQPFNLTQTKGSKQVSEEQTAVKITPFKAKPASVVHQKPFVPKLQRHDILLPSDFHLNTEKRALERQKFEEKMKQKEEENAMILKLQKEEEERLEIEKMVIERKKTEFKANPMPRYRFFEIQEAGPDKLTVPHSPNFSFKTKKGKI